MPDVGNGMGELMKAWTCAKTSLNSNFADLSARNGSIDTENIMTLADYMKKEHPDKMDSFNPELHDVNKLMLTYVVPLTMPNGQRIDLVVNSNGQDLAQIYIDEEGKDRFHLDENVVEKIRIMTQGAIDKDALYKDEFCPDTLEKMAEKIAKDELVPKTEENVKERKEKADEKRSLLEDKENEENEKSPEQIAGEMGMELSALEKYCEENDIDINSIKGAQKIENSEKFETAIGQGAGVAYGETVVAVKISGKDGKLNSIGLMKEDGSTINYGGKGEDFLNEMVREGSSSNEELNNDDYDVNKTIEIEHEDGTVHDHNDASVNQENDADYFKERYEKVVADVKKWIEMAENDESIEPEVRDRMIADFKAYGYGQLCKLERETGVNIPSLHEEQLAEAQEAENTAEKTEIKEAIKDVGEGVLNSGKYIAGAAAGALMNKRREGTDPRETNHDRSEGPLPKYFI